MTRDQLEHIIRAAGAIADTEDLVVIGSQAILGQFADASDADVFPRDDPGRSELIDGSIGEGSPFQREFGYYAHGVDETTAILPAGWQERLILVVGENTRFVRGWCLEVHDLAIAKYVAGREKDLDFTKILARQAMVTREILERRLDVTPLEPEQRIRVLQRIQKDFANAGNGGAG
jgi:hypothetical protein